MSLRVILLRRLRFNCCCHDHLLPALCFHFDHLKPYEWLKGHKLKSKHTLLVCAASLIASSCDDKWIIRFQSIAMDDNGKSTTKVVGDNHLLIDRS